VPAPSAHQIPHDAQPALAIAPFNVFQRQRRRRRIGHQQRDQPPPHGVPLLLQPHQHPRLAAAFSGLGHRGHRVAHQIAEDGVQRLGRQRQLHIQRRQVQPRLWCPSPCPAGRQLPHPGRDLGRVQPRARRRCRQPGQRRSVPVA
jgi:hypothetical protein